MEVKTQILRQHRDNIAAAQSFEEMKAAQLKYIDFLIARSEAYDAQRKAETEFINEQVGLLYKWSLAKNESDKDEAPDAPDPALD